MPFDTLTLAAVADDVRLLVGGQVQRIIQPRESAIALSVYSGGRQQWLLASADAQTARVSVVGGALAKAFPTPSPFVMLLRKHLEGARLRAVEQLPGERVLMLTWSHGDVRHQRLVVEIMGKHSNVLLLDADDRVLGALKFITSRQSRVRPILPGRNYTPPPMSGRDERLFPTGPRLDPRCHVEELAALLRELPPNTPVSAALLGILPGISPFLCEQISWDAGLHPDSPMASVDVAILTIAAADRYRMFDGHDWQPVSFVGRRNRRDFAPFIPRNVSAINRAPTMSQAVEEVLGGHENRDALATVRNAVSEELSRARRAADRRVASLSRGLTATSEASDVMQRGQLILAYQHAIGPRASTLEIPDLGLQIPLDPRLDAQANAERAFRRYRKLRDAAQRIPHLLKGSRTEQARLEDLAVFLELADNEADLRQIQREIAAVPAEVPSSRTPRRSSGPPRFRLGSFTVITGRNARENEEVTFRLGTRGDLWLHARGHTGAHVLLRGPDPSDDVIHAAAALAAYFSAARHDTAVDVDVTAVRNVRKLPGGPPGRVSYRNERTVRVEPGRGEWQPVRGA